MGEGDPTENVKNKTSTDEKKDEKPVEEEEGVKTDENEKKENVDEKEKEKEKEKSKSKNNIGVNENPSSSSSSVQKSNQGSKGKGIDKSTNSVGSSRKNSVKNLKAKSIKKISENKSSSTSSSSVNSQSKLKRKSTKTLNHVKSSLSSKSADFHSKESLSGSQTIIINKDDPVGTFENKLIDPQSTSYSNNDKCKSLQSIEEKKKEFRLPDICFNKLRKNTENEKDYLDAVAKGDIKRVCIKKYLINLNNEQYKIIIFIYLKVYSV